MDALMIVQLPIKNSSLDLGMFPISDAICYQLQAPHTVSKRKFSNRSPVNLCYIAGAKMSYGPISLP